MDARQLGNRRDAEQIPELGAQHVHQRGVVACEQVGPERAPPRTDRHHKGPSLRNPPYQTL